MKLHRNRLWLVMVAGLMLVPPSAITAWSMPAFTQNKKVTQTSKHLAGHVALLIAANALQVAMNAYYENQSKGLDTRSVTEALKDSWNAVLSKVAWAEHSAKVGKIFKKQPTRGVQGAGDQLLDVGGVELAFGDYKLWSALAALQAAGLIYSGVSLKNTFKTENARIAAEQLAAENARIAAEQLAAEQLAAARAARIEAFEQERLDARLKESAAAKQLADQHCTPYFYDESNREWQAVDAVFYSSVDSVDPALPVGQLVQVSSRLYEVISDGSVKELDQDVQSLFVLPEKTVAEKPAEEAVGAGAAAGSSWADGIEQWPEFTQRDAALVRAPARGRETVSWSINLSLLTSEELKALSAKMSQYLSSTDPIRDGRHNFNQASGVRKASGVRVESMDPSVPVIRVYADPARAHDALMAGDRGLNAAVQPLLAGLDDQTAEEKAGNGVVPPMIKDETFSGPASAEQMASANHSTIGSVLGLGGDSLDELVAAVGSKVPVAAQASATASVREPVAAPSAPVATTADDSTVEQNSASKPNAAGPRRNRHRRGSSLKELRISPVGAPKDRKK